VEPAAFDFNNTSVDPIVEDAGNSDILSPIFYITPLLY